MSHSFYCNFSGVACHQTYHCDITSPIDSWSFLQKMHFLDILAVSGWISAKLALIWLKMHLQHDSLPFLPLASRFMTFWLGHVLKSKF